MNKSGGIFGTSKKTGRDSDKHSVCFQKPCIQEFAMFSLPNEFIIILESFRKLFSPSVRGRAQTLVMGAILCQGNRTVASCLRAVGLGNSPDFYNYHNVLRRAHWSGLAAAKILLGGLIVLFVPANASLVIAADETLERRQGKKIKAKGWYRGALRSKGKQVVSSLGLEWLCLMLIVPVPWSARQWALPFWTMLQPSKQANEEAGKRHKTSIDWTIQALKQLRCWQPTRRLIFLVDGGFASFNLLEECCRLHMTMICRLRIDAKLYDFPPEPTPGKRGPKPKKGALLTALKTLTKDESQPWQKAILPWYQEDQKSISYLSGVALMHKTKHLPIAVKLITCAALQFYPNGELTPKSSARY